MIVSFDRSTLPAVITAGTLPFLAKAALSADDDVTGVVLHQGYPRRGEVTIEIKGGDIALVEARLAERAPADIVCHVQVYSDGRPQDAPRKDGPDD